MKKGQTSSDSLGRFIPPIFSVILIFPIRIPKSMISSGPSASSSYVKSAAIIGVGSRSPSSSSSSLISSAIIVFLLLPPAPGPSSWLPARVADLTTTCSKWRSSDPTFSFISVSLSWLASSSLGPM